MAPRASPEPGFAYRSAFGKAVVDFLSAASSPEAFRGLTQKIS